MAEAPRVGYYNPNLRKQGEKTRNLAAKRSAEKTAEKDPYSYGAVSGALEESPYEGNPLSVFDPKRKKVEAAQNVTYPLAIASSMIPGSKAAKDLYKKAKSLLSSEKPTTAAVETTSTLDKLANAPMSRRGFLKAASSPLVASAIGKPASFLPPIESLVTQAAPATTTAATVTRTVAPLTAASLAKVQNFLPHVTRMNRGPDYLDRADLISVVKPEGMTNAEFIRALKQHPKEFKKFKEEIDHLQQAARYTEFHPEAADSKQAYLEALQDRSPAAIAREARMWDQNLNPFGQGKLLYEPYDFKYLPEDIRYKVFELDMADDILEKLPKSKGGELAKLPSEVKNRLLLPLVGKPIAQVKRLMNSLQLTLPAEVAQLKDSRSVTTKMLEHFSQDPEKLLAQAQTITPDKAPKEVMSAFKKFDTDTQLLPEELDIKRAQKEVDDAKYLLDHQKWVKNNQINAAKTIDPETGTLLYTPERIAAIDDKLKASTQAYDLAKEKLEKLKAAPYTQEVLPAAEREANLQAMQAESAAPGDWYHGTSRDIKEFKPQQADATFFSKDPNFVEDYAFNSNAWMGENVREFLTPEQIAAAKPKAVQLMKNRYGRENRPHQAKLEAEIQGESAAGEALDYLNEAYKDMLPSGPNIMKVKLGVKNPWDYENPAHVEALLDEINGDPRFMNLTSEQLSKGAWERIEGPGLQEAIRRLGYDAFYMNEGGVKNIGVYDPAKIKSAIGNVGTYDLKNPEINKKAGGSVSRYSRR